MNTRNKSVSVSPSAMLPDSIGNSVTDKFLIPAIAENNFKNSLTLEEKYEYIKQKYNLHHGKGKRKKKRNKKKKGR